MRAVDRTTKLFVASVRDALPDVRLQVARSKNAAGRSNYVYLYCAGIIKVRISDHSIGLNRAKFGHDDLLIQAGTTPDRWAVWLGRLVRRLAPSGD